MSLTDFVPFLPEIVLSVVGFILLVAGVAWGKSGIRAMLLTGVGGLALTVLLVWLVARPDGEPRTILGDMLVIDGFGFYFKLLLAAASAIALLMSAGYLERSRYGAGEYVSLVLFATAGMFVMVSAANLASLYVGLELMALSVYVLVGYFKLEHKSNEGAVKYFVLGALSSGVLLYGISLLYGALGTLDLTAIRSGLAAAPDGDLLVMLGILLVGFGMLFKVAAVPFHVWTPDAYEGAPTPVTAFMSVGPKAAAFAIFLRLFAGTFAPEADQWRVVLIVAAALTMVYGNVAALTQTNVKRMLAYSSIAHAGYALMGLAAVSAMGTWSVLMYMLVYAFMNLGAFGFVILLETRGYAGETIDDYAGLARRYPAAAAGMLLFLLSLTGIPPTAGFMGKLYLFAAAIQAGYAWLAVVGLLMSAVSLYYYFRLVVQMYLKDGPEDQPAPLARDRWLEAMLGVCAVVTLAIGVWPAPVVAWAQSGLNALGLQ